MMKKTFVGEQDSTEVIHIAIITGISGNKFYKSKQDDLD